MPDENDFSSLGMVVLAFAMNLGYQGASGIDDRQIARARLTLDVLRYAMGAEDRDGAVGNVADLFDENRAFGTQRFDDTFVVHDFMAHIDRRAETFYRTLDDLDGPFDPRTKAARLRKDHVNDAFVAFRHLKFRPIMLALGNN